MQHRKFPVRPRILLTGATGLLGRYLLQRFLVTGHEVGVVVRAGGSQYPTPTLRARQRVEQVLQPFETHRLLPRPRTIAWELTRPANSIAAEDLRWLRQSPTIVVHSAASIRFQRDAKTDEPYRTNVQGTENLLELCKSLNVAAFHHVSTAYVGDHRHRHRVFEHVVDDDRAAGNDYEKSKIAAERAVLAARHIGPVIFHRPSIIVGDSQSLFSSTFHGYYAPLQIGWQYARMFGFSDEAGEWFRQQLGLAESDKKNMVTVDWVAEGIARAVESNFIRRPREDAISNVEVLHWTHRQPVACRQIQMAIVDAIQRATQDSHSDAIFGMSSEPNAALAKTPAHTPPSPELFRQQMQAYESYFQNDADFDTSNSDALAAGLICPSVDYALLSRLADWAIAANFGWPKPALPELPHVNLVRSIQELHSNHDTSIESKPNPVVRLELLGPNSPEALFFAKCQERWIGLPSPREFDVNWRVSLANLADCVNRSEAVEPMVSRGYWLVEGCCGDDGLATVKSWLDALN